MDVNKINMEVVRLVLAGDFEGAAKLAQAAKLIDEVMNVPEATCGEDEYKAPRLATDSEIKSFVKAHNAARNGEWFEWFGGIRAPQGRVDVVLRCGSVIEAAESHNLNWTHYTFDGDIVKYRYVD